MAVTDIFSLWEQQCAKACVCELYAWQLWLLSAITPLLQVVEGIEMADRERFLVDLGWIRYHDPVPVCNSCSIVQMESTEISNQWYSLQKGPRLTTLMSDAVFHPHTIFIGRRNNPYILSCDPCKRSLWQGPAQRLRSRQPQQARKPWMMPRRP